MAIIIRKHQKPELYKHVVNSNLIMQADFLRLSFDVAIKNGFKITVPFITDLHRISMNYLVECPGELRNHEVQIKGGVHQPPSHDKIQDELVKFIQTIQSNWNVWDEIKLAAYAKWQLDWIHPFEDGNGRTSRALTYFILCCKAKLLFKGNDTVIQQLRDRREDVFESLRIADKNLASSDHKNPTLTDLSKLEALIEDMVKKQFLSAVELRS